MTPFVSVVVPTYNRAHCLRDAIDSALGQTHRALEVVVVDDGSTDGTGELLDRFYGRNPRVRCILQANAGVSAARNRALAAAGGDWVAFLDSDDVWEPWKIEMQLAAFRAFPDVGVVWTDMTAVGPTGAVVNPRHLHSMYVAYRYFRREELFDRSVLLDRPGAAGMTGAVTAYAGTIYPQIIMGNLVHTSTVLLARDRLERIAGFDETFREGGEDYDFHLRSCREGPVAFLDVSSIRYRVGTPDQLTARPGTFAINFLKTVRRTLDEEGGRVALPPALLTELFRYGHAWAAEDALATGRPGEAREHCLKSLAQRPWQPRVWVNLAASLLPRGMGRGLLDACRTTRRAWRAASRPS